ncbi:LytR/AlgR family response regulator transcription factor [Sphingobacterium bovistauri]|uniref:Response regulator transcription factor n=1 Tax=Sphingobacterium bovistauri TaxID=2781959 RepID=A0ABS7Z0N4_9SPHI|nr:LytTR family DNA-binding domain-containing protein [Sphingobacterium bovistauri]MCA5003725.1 response regulator transcription factor [Sphingobacterium bovistauri]
MQLNCYIVDDEPSAIETLSLLIKRYCPTLHIVGSACTVDQALQDLHNDSTDILFLDIKMQNETGFDLLHQLNVNIPHIIFVTAHDEYGIQAIKFSATDYLLKPVNTEELIAAVHKVTLKKQMEKQQMELLLEAYQQAKHVQQKRIALADQNEIRYILIENIICCKSDNSYTTFYIAHQTAPIVVSTPISEYENILSPYGFQRIHQSWLINKSKVLSYKKEDGGFLIMENMLSVPVSRQRKHLLKEL